MANAAAANKAFIDPAVLARLGNLDLIARTLMKGVLIGLHRSPDFGISQEFAEYRAYNEGDDPRLIDWNVYARTDRTYIKRFLGETNSRLMLALDTSASMGFRSRDAALSKLDYGRYLAASLAYLAHRQRDAIGLLCFDEELRDLRPPSSRHGQLQWVIQGLQQAAAESGSDFHQPLKKGLSGIRRSGMVAVISDFYCDCDQLLDSLRPLAIQGHDLMLFHLMDPMELVPKAKHSQLFQDSETGEVLEVSARFLEQDYPARLEAHLERLKQTAIRSGADYQLINTAEPLEKALHHYLSFRERRA